MTSTSIPSLFSVAGRTALITGGSSGLGLMIAEGLVTNGSKVYITGLANDPISSVVASLNELGVSSGNGGSAIGFPSDVSTKEGIAELAAAFRAHESHLDILVSNAGIRRDPAVSCDVLQAPLSELQASLWSSSHSDWTSSFAVNTAAHYFLSVALLDLLAAAAGLKMEDGREGREVGRGVVVVTSSCASMHNATNVDMMSYASTKAATDHLVKLLAAKFARWYVRVVGINPGFVPSAMNPMGSGDSADIFGDLVSKVPAKRAAGTEDIAGTVIYLASQAGAYVDGRSLCIDGGRVLFANGQT